MVGFIIGASFSPEAYQFFPYFSVAYTAALLATISERETTPTPSIVGKVGPRYQDVRVKSRRSDALTFTR
jgi:hypothetical protein